MIRDVLRRYLPITSALVVAEFVQVTSGRRQVGQGSPARALAPPIPLRVDNPVKPLRQQALTGGAAASQDSCNLQEARWLTGPPYSTSLC